MLITRIIKKNNQDTNISYVANITSKLNLSLV